MSTSELHSRLEHLVSYSSQLIFVGHDKISQQNKVVEAFLGNQAENTEVAMIDATQTTFLRDYRYQLFKQLIGTSSTADFERPLNQLLSALNEYNGPILIIVSHAENLPQKFLQELWELVLQSRFAANKQHLNVLLFAPSEWAEKAKTWLPTGSGNKPIVLNSSSFLSVEGDVNNPTRQTELEQLISAKRQQFAERIRGREHHYEAIQPVLQKPWLAGLVIMLFIGVFGGMLYWQYPEVAHDWLKQLGKTFDTETNTKPTEQTPILTDNINDNMQLTSVTSKQVMPSDGALEDSGKPDILQPFSAQVIQLDPARLVTDWKNAVKQIDQATTRRLTQSTSEPVHQADSVQGTSLTTQSNISQAHLAVEEIANSPSEEFPRPTGDVPVNDYQVEDISSQAQLETASAQGQSVTFVAAGVPRKSAVSATEQTNPSRFGYDESTLLALPANRYLLQLAAMSDPQTLQAYIQQHQLQNQVWIYKTQRSGSDWLVLLHNRSFLTLNLAKEAISSLSPALQQGPPFVKTYKQVRQEINH